MKKIVFLSLFALCLPWTLVAQSIDDDLYYVPSKKKEEKVEKKKTPAADAVVVKTNAPTTVYASPGNTTIVVKDRKGCILIAAAGTGKRWSLRESVPTDLSLLLT